MRSLRVRLLLLMLFVLVATGSLAAWLAGRAIANRFEQYLISRQEASEARQARLALMLPELLAERYERAGSWAPVSELVHHIGELTDERIMVTDAQGTIRYVSPSVERVLGYRSEEMVGTGTAEYVHPKDLERALWELAEAASKPGVHPVAVETRVRHKDGSWRYLEGIANNLLDDPVVGAWCSTTGTSPNASGARMRSGA